MGEEHFGLKKNYYKYVARHWYASYTNLNDDYSKRSICSKMNLEKSWLSFYGNYCCLVAKSCPTLGDPMDCSPAGSSVHGISQARILEWLDISSPGNGPKSPTLAGGFFTMEPPGKPQQDLHSTLNNGAKRACSEMEFFHHL